MKRGKKEEVSSGFGSPFSKKGLLLLAGVLFILIVLKSIGGSIVGFAVAGTGSGMFIFGDSLNSRFSDISWDGVSNFNEASVVYSGTRSVAWTPGANGDWAALSLGAWPPVSIENYTHLRIFVNGGNSNTQEFGVTLSLYYNESTGAGSSPRLNINNYIQEGSILAGQWVKADVPLADLGVRMQPGGRIPNYVGRFTLQDVTGVAQPRTYFDEIEFYNDGAVSTPVMQPVDKWLDGWSDCSWGADVDYGATEVVRSGSYSARFTMKDTWAGMQMCTGSFDTSPYNRVSFYVNGGNGSGQKLSFSMGGAWVELNASSLEGGVIDNTWRKVDVSLADLGALQSIISKIKLQDVSGFIEPSVYIDDVYFYHDGSAPPPPQVTLIAIDAATSKRPISPLIYGISSSDGARPYFKDMGVSLVRWGGNARTRFNWEINSSNLGSDYYYMNSRRNTPDDFIGKNKGQGAESLITIPMIGWVAKDYSSQSSGQPAEGGSPASAGSSVARLCSGSTYNPATNRQRTSFRSFARKNSSFVYPPDLGDRAVYQDEWVASMVSKYGLASQGGVRFYAMDNELDLWADDTHVDVHPVRVGYDESLALFLEYAKAVKAVDPTAQVTGAVGWGWLSLWYTALDIGCGGSYSGDDRTAHGGVPYYKWLLGKVKEHDDAVGYRTLDVLDTHIGPQGTLDDARRLRSIRSLWDPTYQEESWMRNVEGPYLRWIPRLQEWINESYPGTKIGVSEWYEANGVEDRMVGALAAAEVFGVYGREGIYFATYWGVPAENTPTYWAWRMYRNYDGNYSTFGDQSIKAATATEDVDKLSAYASVDNRTGSMKIMLLNKMPVKSITASVSLANFNPGQYARIYQYSNSDRSGIKKLQDIEVSGSSLNYTVPPYSIVLIEVPGSSVPVGPKSMKGLHVSGNRILNEFNQSVRLLGVNRGTSYPCIQGWGIFPRGQADEASVQAMLRWNITAVRVPLNEDCWLDINQGTSPDEYFGAYYRNAIIDYVNLLSKHNIATVLDLHWNSPGTIRAMEQQPMPDRDHSPAFWTSVANTFKNNSYVVFDLYNEPYPDENVRNNDPNDWKCLRDGGCTYNYYYDEGNVQRSTSPWVAAGMQELVDAVRVTGSENLIMTAGIGWAGLMTYWLNYTPVDPANNLAAATHLYDGSWCSDVACWNRDLAPILEKYPLIVGEIGEVNCDQRSFLDRVVPWLDGKGASYQAWHWWTEDDVGCQGGYALLGRNTAGDPYVTGAPSQVYGAAYRDYLLAAASGSPPIQLPPPKPVAKFVIYNDSLNPEWWDGSWDGVRNWAVASPRFSGANSVSFTLTSAWGALFVGTNRGLYTSPFTNLRFYIHGGTAGNQKFNLLDADGLVNEDIGPYIEGGSIAANTWRKVDIPLSSIGLNDKVIGGIMLQDALGRSQPVVYIDDIEFYNASMLVPVAACNLTSASWSASSVISNTNVTLTVRGVDCNGQTVSFLVRERDAASEGGVDVDASSQPSPNNAVFVNDAASITWNAQYMQDGAFDPPEFYFIANLGTGSISSPDLTVTRVATSPQNISIAPRPMVVISRNIPAYASSSAGIRTPNNANDYSYEQDNGIGSFWRSTSLPAWIAYNLSRFSVTNRSKVVLAWYQSDTNAYQYDVASGGTPVGLPRDYAIEANSAPGSSSVPSAGWVTLVAVTGNKYRSRQHVLNLSAYNWVRLNVSSVRGSNPNVVLTQMDIYDLSQSGYQPEDSWIFYGDSITVGALNYEETWWGSPLNFSFASLVHSSLPAYFPAQENGGIVGASIIDLANNFDSWLSVFPGKYVAISYGTNDASVGHALSSSEVTAFYNNYENAVKKVIAAGKVPIIPKIPWGPANYATRFQENVQTLNAQIDKLYTDYPAIIRGPDFWTFFQNNQNLLSGDVHPTNEGYGEMRRLWAQTMIQNVYNAKNVPPARIMPFSPEVWETFEDEPVGLQPRKWKIVYPKPYDLTAGYDGEWKVRDYGPPFGRIAGATKIYDSSGASYPSYLTYRGNTTTLVDGEIPKNSHYYVESLIHMKEPVNHWSNEHTLQGIFKPFYDLEILTWTGDRNSSDARWGLRLYANGGERFIADWGNGGTGVTDNTGEKGWGWWARLGMDINLRTKEVEVYYNGNKVIGPIVVDSVGTVNSNPDKLYADLRAINNYLEFDDFRIYFYSEGPPVVSNGLPSGSLPAGAGSVNLSVNTDKAAVCRYSVTPGLSFDGMAGSFVVTGGFFHTTLVSGLSDNSSYSYYVKCREGLNNTNAVDYNVMFSVLEPQASSAAMPWLKTQGNQILTENGQQVILRGANVIRSEWVKNMDFERQAIPHLANDWKGNIFLHDFASAPVADTNYDKIVDGMRVTHQMYMSWLDEYVSLAEENNMYVILTFYTKEVNGDMPDLPDDEAQQALAILAARYKGKPNVIFQLQAEPDGHWPGASETWWYDTLLPRYNSMVVAIRNASAPYKPLILASGTNWGRKLEYVDNPVNRVTADSGINIVYSSHAYDSVSNFDVDFLNAYDSGLPVMITEFGTGSQMTQSDTDELLRIMRERNISWTAWLFDNEGPPTLLQPGSDRYDFVPSNPYGVSVRNEMLTTPRIPGVIYPSSPLTILNGAPSGYLSSGTSSVNLSVNTDKAAVCRYSVTPGLSFDGMAGSFVVTGGTFHTSYVSGLSDNSSYSYYVTCREVVNISNVAGYSIIFSVLQPGSSIPRNAEYYVFNESLAAGWESWSWRAMVDFTWQRPYSGTYSLSYAPLRDAQGNGDGALWLVNTGGADLSLYENLSFWINGGARGGQSFTIAASLPDDSIGTSKDLNLYVDGGLIAANEWKLVNVPLKDLAGSGRQIKGIVLQDSTGGAQQAVYIDEMLFYTNKQLPPRVSGGKPTGSLKNGTREVNLSVATDVSATCKYSQVPGQAYVLMPNTFTSTGGIQHTSLITGLSDNTSNSFYVRCLGNNGMISNEDYVVSFSIQSPPRQAAPSNISSYWIFADSLKGFGDCSYYAQVLDFASPSYVRTGTASIAFQNRGNGDWGAFSLCQERQAFNASDYSHLRFYINGGSGSGQQFRIGINWYKKTGPGSEVFLHSGGASLNTFISGGSIAANEWRLVDVPLSEIGMKTGISGLYPDAIGRFSIQDTSGGTSQPTIYLDDIELYSDGTPVPEPLGPEDKWLNSTWYDCSWSMDARSDSSDYAYFGRYSTSLRLTDAWGAYSVCRAYGTGDVDLSPFNRLKFYVNGGSASGQKYAITLGGERFDIDNFTEGGSIASGQWRKVDIPLAALGAEGSAVSRITLQSVTGDVQPTIYIDNLSFYHDGSPPPAPEDMLLMVDAGADNHAISPFIYGLSTSDGSQPYFGDMGVSLVRWGGNARTRFNWEINSSNLGSDYYYMNSRRNTPDDFIGKNKGQGAESLITIPMIGWVAKDYSSQSSGQPAEGGSPASANSSIARLCSGSTYNPATNRQRTSFRSFARKNSSFAYPPDLGDDAVYQDEWVARMVSKYGRASQGGVRFYAMDNELDLWADDTHVDVHPVRVGYDESLALFLEYAKAVKAVDPTADITAPVGWGYLSMWYSGLDRGCGPVYDADDRTAHGDVPYYKWLLGKVKEHDDAVGYRTLDVLDTHIGPQGSMNDARRFRAVRSYWDPTYQEESWMKDVDGGPYLRWIPRLREWIDEAYPGTKIGVSEWYDSNGIEDRMVGGLLAADVLGVYGREDVYFATYWGYPAENTPTYWAWRMYRNYDGIGTGFGDVSARAVPGNVEKVSAYASKDSATGELKLMLINKLPSKRINAVINLSSFQAMATAQVFEYSNSNQERIIRKPNMRVVDNSLNYTLPPYSISLIIFDSVNNQSGQNEENLSRNCIESDGGKHYYVYGFTNATVARNSAVNWDFCAGDSLAEQYCNGDTSATDTYRCPNGCENGACINVTCTDSDGGKNVYVFGSIMNVTGRSNATNWDYCLGDSVYEQYCGGTEKYRCPLGCSNGVCVKGQRNWSDYMNLTIMPRVFVGGPNVTLVHRIIQPISGYANSFIVPKPQYYNITLFRINESGELKDILDDGENVSWNGSSGRETYLIVVIPAPVKKEDRNIVMNKSMYRKKFNISSENSFGNVSAILDINASYPAWKLYELQDRIWVDVTSRYNLGVNDSSAVFSNFSLSDKEFMIEGSESEPQQPIQDSQPGGSSSGGGGGGGGGGGSKPSSDKVSKAWSIIMPGFVTMNVSREDYSVRSISIEALVPIRNAELSIAKKDSSPFGAAPGEVYQYFSIDTKNLNSSVVGSIMMDVAVNKSWLAKRGYLKNDVVLYRYSGQWEAIPLTVFEDSGSRTAYKASLPGFSYFAVSGITAPVKSEEVKIEVVAPDLVSAGSVFNATVRILSDRGISGRKLVVGDKERLVNIVAERPGVFDFELKAPDKGEMIVKAQFGSWSAVKNVKIIEVPEEETDRIPAMDEIVIRQQYQQKGKVSVVVVIVGVLVFALAGFLLLARKKRN